MQSVVIDAIRINKIDKTEVTFDISCKSNVEKYRQKIWVSMIAEKNT